MKNEQQMNPFNFSKKRNFIISFAPLLFVFITQFCFMAYAGDEAPNNTIASSSTTSSSSSNNGSTDPTSQQSSSDSVSCQGASCSRQGKCFGTFQTTFNAVNSAGQLLTASASTGCEPEDGGPPRCGDRRLGPGGNCDDGDGGGSGTQGTYCGNVGGPNAPIVGYPTGSGECNGRVRARGLLGNEGCTPVTCVLAYCGDGTTQDWLFEKCDDKNFKDDDDCIECQPARCGDGKINKALGLNGKPKEECDQGPAGGGQICDGTCQLFCGNGKKEKWEGCDDGAAKNGKPGNKCKADCTEVDCGNGKVDPGETCDPKDPATKLNCNPARCQPFECIGDFGMLANDAPGLAACGKDRCYKVIVPEGTTIQCIDCKGRENANETCTSGSGTAIDTGASCKGDCSYLVDTGKVCPEGGYNAVDPADTVVKNGKSYIDYKEKKCCLCGAGTEAIRPPNPGTCPSMDQTYSACIADSTGYTPHTAYQPVVSSGASPATCSGTIQPGYVGINNNAVSIEGGGVCYALCKTCDCEISAGGNPDCADARSAGGS